MGDFEPAFVHALAQQSWSLYGVGMLLILIRLYARVHRLGIKGLQRDDYLMMLAGCTYTTLIVCLNVISGGGGSNLFPPEQFDTFTPENIKKRIQGSKIVIVSEQAMLCTIYLIKACMLLLYRRLTLGLQVQRLVVCLAVYVLVGWVSTEIAFFTACTPFSGYWAMPPPNPQCTTLEHYAIVQGCFNISSDLLMICIPLPLITKLNVPFKQKVILLIIFSMGFFVIIAAILTKVFNLSNVWDPSYMLWYTREASVAIYVSNLPMIWPLLREWFPSLIALSPAKSATPKSRSTLSRITKRKFAPIDDRTSSDFQGSGVGKSDGIITTIRGQAAHQDMSSDSDETELKGITRKDSWDATPERGDGSEPGGGAWERPGELNDLGQSIHMTTTVHVSHEQLSSSATAPARSVLPSAVSIDAERRDIERGDQDSQFGWDFERVKGRRI